MPIYRATKPFHLGALRLHVQADELLSHDGSVVRVRGKEHPVPGFDGLVEAGLVVLADPSATFPDVAPPAPPKQAPGKPHTWDTEFGSTQKTCRVCGVTVTGDETSSIQADRPSLRFKYRDAYNVSIESTVELPCPLFLGHLGGAIAGANHQARRLKTHVESIDERVARLEAENAQLRELTNQRQEEALGLLRRLVSRTENLTQAEPTLLLADTSQIFDAFEIPAREPERIRVVLDQAVEED